MSEHLHRTAERIAALEVPPGGKPATPARSALAPSPAGQSRMSCGNQDVGSSRPSSRSRASS